MPKVEFLTRQQKRERTVDEIIDIYRKRKHITKVISQKRSICHVLLLM